MAKKQKSKAKSVSVSKAAGKAEKARRKPEARPAPKPSPKPAPKGKATAKGASAATKTVTVTAVVPGNPLDGKTNKLTVTQKRKFLDLLTAIRARLSNQISEHRSESLRREDGVNAEEDGTDAFDRQFTLGLVSAEHDLIFEIEEAERRLSNGTYGLCEVCACPIEPLRLQAIPFVRNCVRCQSEREGRRGIRRDMLGVR
jgi:RNA polymerase-binding transcription factor DksA